ncbi:MAG: DUF4089 domain-containing protein [Methylovirgula sp.]
MRSGPDVSEAALAAWCDTMAELLDLPIATGDRAEIIANLRVLAQLMQLVADFSLDDRAEPAPIFKA